MYSNMKGKNYNKHYDPALAFQLARITEVYHCDQPVEAGPRTKPRPPTGPHPHAVVPFILLVSPMDRLRKNFF